MRPPKRILVIDADPERRGLLAYTLEVNGYRVFRAESLKDALRRSRVDLFETAIALAPLDSCELQPIVRNLDCQTILICDSPAEMPKAAWAHHTLNCMPSTASLLRLLEITTGRPRGPRKGSHRTPVQLTKGQPCKAPNSSTETRNW